jgi:hypothetical protein
MTYMAAFNLVTFLLLLWEYPALGLGTQAGYVDSYITFLGPNKEISEQHLKPEP